ncbi:methyltransferase domain-containing protein [[Limnothrix rosea] IAM M-220]|uniref:methyltransferase domain-containing protein n=1 Tax=[Limnothrix rosea] IAM M-220 TaxID=454133 RepID=UPI00095C1411|nr:methyltransferase domain-containing protein [[Limnothrix rosea] IAM M-220]OKH16895.1 SAM-dependent methyltransferase [[Limnothrix rosea] IAM M-220]
MAQSIEQSSFWETKYRSAEFRWDLGEATPPLVEFFGRPIAPSAGKIIALGAGRGHDAVFLAQQGLMVTAVDFAPSAIAATQKLAQAKNVNLTTLEQDIFTLEKSYKNQFDYVFEHTCFCAIPPERRHDYVQLVATLLKPAGTFYGVFFTHGRAGGPPFGTTPTEIEQLFSPYFTVKTLTAVTNSVPSRQGDEHWGIFRRML